MMGRRDPQLSSCGPLGDSGAHGLPASLPAVNPGQEVTF